MKLNTLVKSKRVGRIIDILNMLKKKKKKIEKEGGNHEEEERIQKKWMVHIYCD